MAERERTKAELTRTKAELARTKTELASVKGRLRDADDARERADIDRVCVRLRWLEELERREEEGCKS